MLFLNTGGNKVKVMKRLNKTLLLHSPMPEEYPYISNVIIHRGARMASERIVLVSFSSREQSTFLRKCANMESLGPSMPLKSIYTFSESLQSQYVLYHTNSIY